MPRTLIGSLLDIRGPSAIRWLVVPVWVDAIKRVSGLPFTEVREEILEAAAFADEPSITDSDPPCPISLERGVSRFVTSTDHRQPTLVSQGVTHAVRCRGIAEPRFCLLRMAGKLRAVVTTDESAGLPTNDSGQLTTTARTWLRLLRRSLAEVMSLPESSPLLISQIGAPVESLTTTTSAQRRVEPMAAQKVRRAITEQLGVRNVLTTSTFAFHSSMIPDLGGHSQ